MRSHRYAGKAPARRVGALSRAARTRWSVACPPAPGISTSRRPCMVRETTLAMQGIVDRPARLQSTRLSEGYVRLGPGELWFASATAWAPLSCMPRLHRTCTLVRSSITHGSLSISLRTRWPFDHPGHPKATSLMGDQQGQFRWTYGHWEPNQVDWETSVELEAL